MYGESTVRAVDLQTGKVSWFHELRPSRVARPRDRGAGVWEAVHGEG